MGIKDKYEIIIPERIYIVIGLEEVRKVLERHPRQGISVRLMKEGEL